MVYSIAPWLVIEMERQRKAKLDQEEDDRRREEEDKKRWGPHCNQYLPIVSDSQTYVIQREPRTTDVKPLG